MLPRDRIELQIRLVLLALRTEGRTRSNPNLPGVVERANGILRSLEPRVSGDPELEAALEEAVREADALRGGGAEELVDPGE